MRNFSTIEGNVVFGVGGDGIVTSTMLANGSTRVIVDVGNDGTVDLDIRLSGPPERASVDFLF